jgi:hypothetical protein
MPSGPVALKEWASSVTALTQGLQIMMLRKGGIAEETKEFELRSGSFYLFPAYEHQKKELLKPEYRTLIDETLAVWNPDDDEVTIEAYAEAAEDIELTDLDAVHRLLPHHIWTDTFAEERLHWKRQKPLHLLLLRVYKLNRPVQVKKKPEYYGCKSWIELEPSTDFDADRQPVLTDEEFRIRTELIKRALQG